MPQVKTETLNANGYYDTKQTCEKLMIGREKLDELRQSGKISKAIRKGMKWGYEANEILKIQKQMLKNGGAL
jgi:hypothetical protein